VMHVNAPIKHWIVHVKNTNLFISLLVTLHETYMLDLIPCNLNLKLIKLRTPLALYIIHIMPVTSWCLTFKESTCNQHQSINTANISLNHFLGRALAWYSTENDKTLAMPIMLRSQIISIYTMCSSQASTQGINWKWYASIMGKMQSPNKY
jgi:hypothetical protein